MKGQTQAVTAVMLTGVIVGAVGTVYVWGTPILEKRQSQSQVTAVEEGAFDLYEEIQSVSESGSGVTSTVRLDVNGQITLDEKNDYIELTTQADQSPYPGWTWTLIEGTSIQNTTIGAGDYAIRGSNNPGVIAVQSSGGEGSSEITYRVEFRNLYSSDAETPLSKIDLVADGERRAAGQTEVVLSNQGTEVDRDMQISTGETMDRRRSVVQVSFE
jgi:hypothetical protein